MKNQWAYYVRVYYLYHLQGNMQFSASDASWLIREVDASQDKAVYKSKAAICRYHYQLRLSQCLSISFIYHKLSHMSLMGPNEIFFFINSPSKYLCLGTSNAILFSQQESVLSWLNAERYNISC